MNALEKQWTARVEVRSGETKFARKCETPAENQEQARQRIEAAIRSVWSGWSVRFITPPEVVR